MWSLDLIKEINKSPEKFAWAITGEIGVARRKKAGRALKEGLIKRPARPRSK